MYSSNNMILDYIFYFVLQILACFFTPGYNLFIKTITLDSLYSAYDFCKHFFNRDISESQIVTRSSTLYKGSLLDRYILYGLQYVFYSLMCMLFWQTDFYSVYTSMVVLTLPPLVNRVLTSKCFEKVRQIKEKMVKIIIAKQFATVIKRVSKFILDKDIVVKHKELLPLLDNYKNSVNYFLEAIKNGLIVLLLSYVKNNAAKTYYRLTKYFYAYKTGDTLKSFNAVSAKKTLLQVVENKEWDQFKKPNVYSAILQLYQLNNDDSDFIYKSLQWFNLKLLKMFSIWTIASLCNTVFVAPIISLLLMLYRNKKYTRQRIVYETGILLSSAIIGYLTGSFPLTSFCCQFGYNLLFNNVSYSICRFIKKKTRKFGIILYKKGSSYIPTYLYVSLYMMILGFVTSPYVYIFTCIHLVYDGITNNNTKKSLIFLTMLFTTYLSNFNPIHVVINSLLTFLFFTLCADDVYKFFCTINYQQIYKRVKEFKSENNLKSVFEMLDIKKFPPIFGTKQPHMFILNKLRLINNVDNKDIEIINKQTVIKRIDSDNYDDVFSLSDKKFIKAISVETINPMDNQGSESDQDSDKSVGYQIIENFCE